MHLWPNALGKIQQLSGLPGIGDRTSRGPRGNRGDLSDSAALAAIEAGVAELTRDETITLTALRTELAERRSAR
jgi:hypothetical protein